MVVGMSLYAQIREAYTSGESQRSIAKRLGVSRQTVKKYCEGEIMPGVRKEYLRAGDILVLVNGEYVIVEKVQHELLESPVKVYNFQVADDHTKMVRVLAKALPAVQLVLLLQHG